jgi:hypothetical protein
MIVTIATIIIGTIMKIGRTGLIWWNATGLTARTTSSGPETKGITGSGATIILTAMRDAMTGAKRDRCRGFVMARETRDARVSPLHAQADPICKVPTADSPRHVESKFKSIVSVLLSKLV